MRISSLFFLFIMMTGCTLYESGQHEAIQKNSGNIVTYKGLSKDLRFYYECKLSATAPEFLKEPLEVIDSPNTNADYSSYISLSNPFYIAIHRVNAQGNHSSCRVDILKVDSAPTNEIIQDAFAVADEHIGSVSPRQSSSLQ